MTRNMNLKWKKNDDTWELQVNNNIIITIDKNYGVYSIWINDAKAVDYIDHLQDAKDQGLKIAEAIRGGF